MLQALAKSFWNHYTDILGKTIFHPQYFAKIFAESAVELVRKQAYGTLLDIGCGRMPYRERVEPKVKKYIGLDYPSTAKLYHGKYKPDIFADATDIPLPKNSIDTAIMLMVLEHLPDPKKALGEIRRVLKPNGVFITTTVQMYPIHDAPYDFFRYTKYGLLRLYSDSDLKVKKIISQGSFWSFLGLNCNVYMFQTLRDLLKKRTTLILAFLLLPFFYIFSIILNIICLFLSKFSNDKKSGFNISHLIVARKQ